MNTKYSIDNNPLDHTHKIKSMLNEVVTQLHTDVSHVSEPKAKALFETTAEVLDSLITVYNDYEQHSKTFLKNKKN